LNTGYSFLIDYTLQWATFDYQYYDDRPNDRVVYPATYGDTKGTLIKITPKTGSNTNYFRKYTYANLSVNNADYKSLIVDLVDNQYFVIETYKSLPGLTSDATSWSIKTMFGLKDISDVLYDVYINEDNSYYYRMRDDDMRKNICNAYADIISQDINIINNVTAILTQDKDHKFILKLYDPENFYNGGVLRAPTVYTNPTYISPLGGSHAQLSGEVLEEGGTNIRSRGICYSTSPYPTIDNFVSYDNTIVGTGLGTFTCYITGLIPQTTYYYRAFAINSQTVGYGDIINFVSGAPIYSAPFVKTKDASNVLTHQMDMNGEVIDNGWTPILHRGFAYVTGSTNTPDTGTTSYIITIPENGLIGNIFATVTGLIYSTDYSISAFATNICGITYGQIMPALTLPNQPPVIITRGFSKTYNSITINGKLISDDGEAVTEMGFCWNNNPSVDPTTSDTKTVHNPIAFGDFTETLTGLTPSTNYNINTYCINPFFTAYGSPVLITTYASPVSPTVVINNLSLISDTGATVSCSITSNGGDTVTEKGVYYSDSTNPPSISDPYVYSGLGDSSWSSLLTGLTSGTIYYTRAMAKNNFGTSYSPVSIFTTLNIPTVTIDLLYMDITGTKVDLRGGIADNGGDSIVEKGFIINTSPYPNTPKWYGGSGSLFWNYPQITGLTVGVEYYANAYAINTIGIGYSSDTGFTTYIGAQLPALIDPIFSNIKPLDSTADVTSTILNDGGAAVTVRGVCYNTSPGVSILNKTWYDSMGGIGSWTSTLTGLTMSSAYFVKSFAINSVGINYSPEDAFNTYIPNDVTLKAKSSYSGGQVVEIGGVYPITSSIIITRNSVPLNEIWSGSTTSGETLATFMNWGYEVLSYNNSQDQTYYTPLSTDTYKYRYYVYNESCGTPSENKTEEVRIDAVYPFLTCNRTPESTPNGPIPSPSRLSTWCASGDFYKGYIPPNYTAEPMNKIIQLFSTSINYTYTFITGNDNLVYFATPASYGLLSSIIMDGKTVIAQEYVGVTIQSGGNYPGFNDWNTLYNVYAFQVDELMSESMTTKTITYNF